MRSFPFQSTTLRAAHTTAVAGTLVLALAALAGCSANVGNSPQASVGADPAETKKQASAPAKIAMLLPLAGFGQSAAVAKSLKQAGEMALFERDNPSVQLLVKDTGGTAAGAQAAADQAIRDGAEIILGPLFAQSVTAAAPIARRSNTPVVAFSNDTRTAGNGVYLMSFLVKPEVDRIVSYAVSRGKQRFAALIPADAYGDTVEPVFRAAVARAGGTLAHIERYPVGANAMLDPVKRAAEAIRSASLAGAPVDTLFIPGGQDTLPQLAPLLAYNGVDPKSVQLIGTGAWDYPNVGREQALMGGWFPSADPRGWQDFSARFAKTFGMAPPRIASLAYDAVNLAVTLSSGAPKQRYTVATLTRPEGFSGVDGNVIFTPDGLSVRKLAILEVQQHGNNVIDAANEYATPNNVAAGTYRPAPVYGGTTNQSPPPITGSVYVPSAPGL